MAMLSLLDYEAVICDDSGENLLASVSMKDGSDSVRALKLLLLVKAPLDLISARYGEVTFKTPNDLAELLRVAEKIKPKRTDFRKLIRMSYEELKVTMEAKLVVEDHAGQSGEW